MFNLLVLPVKATIRMILNFILALPLLCIVAVCTPQYWLPKVLSEYLTCKTGFFWIIKTADINYSSDTVTIKDITVHNPNTFLSSDCMKIDHITFSTPFIQLIKKNINIPTLEIAFNQLICIYQNDLQNFQELAQKLCCKEKCKKQYTVENLTIKIDGITGLHSYDLNLNSIQYKNALRKKDYTFYNIALNPNNTLQSDQASLAQVCNSLSKQLFDK